MKIKIVLFALITFVTIPTIFAAEAAESRNKLTLSGRALFNISVEFGATARPAPPPNLDPLGNYDDGYFSRDVRDIPDMTWDWSYDNPEQYIGGDLLDLHHVAHTSGDSSTEDSEVQFGPEIVYARELGRQGTPVRWGIEAGFGYIPLRAASRSSVNMTTTLTEDRYWIIGEPPSAHFRGSFKGPGPQLKGPTRRFQSDFHDGAVNFHYDLKGDLFTFRAGPYLELPIGTVVRLRMSAGPAMVLANSSFQFKKTANAGNFWHESSSGDSSLKCLFGGYALAGLEARLSKRWGIEIAGGYQNVGGFVHRTPDASARVNLGETFFASLGMICRF